MNHNGFSIIEIVLALSIVLIAVGVFVGGLLYGSDSLFSQYAQMQARSNASECLHVARWLRDTEGLNGLPEGTHGLVVSGGTWTIAGASDGRGIFTRSMSVTDVGTYDKNVICTAQWDSRFGTESVVLETRISAWNEQ